jgi:hypothetical protein
MSIKIDFFRKIEKNEIKYSDFEILEGLRKAPGVPLSTPYFLFQKHEIARHASSGCLVIGMQFSTNFRPPKTAPPRQKIDKNRRKFTKNNRKVHKNHKKMKILQKIKKNCKKTRKKRNFC